MALVDAATVVFGSPTVLGGAHPHVISAAFLINALRPKLRYFDNRAWAGRKMAELVTGTWLRQRASELCCQGSRLDDQKVEELGSNCAKHKESGII
jgi:flavorubredoxin